jgi:hypothetical protein
MSHKEERLGRLFILDCVAIVIAVFGMLALSGVRRGAEIRGDLIIILLFMTGIRLIIMALGDFTGAARRFWAAGLFILLAELIVIAVEYLMAFGISIRLLLMTAAADFVLVVAVHLIWGRRRKARPAAEDETANKPNWLLRGSVLEDEGAEPDVAGEASADEADTLFEMEADAEEEGEAFEGIGGFFAGREAADGAAPAAAGEESESEMPEEESEGEEAFDDIEALSAPEAPAFAAPEATPEAAAPFDAAAEPAEEAEASTEPEAPAESEVASDEPVAAEAPGEAAAAVSGDISEVEAELGRFIDMVGDQATDRETFEAATQSFRDSLHTLPQKTTDPAILEAGADLAKQLTFVTKRDHLNDAIVDGLIRIAQLLNRQAPAGAAPVVAAEPDEVPPAEPAAKRPASVDISADRRTVSASRVPAGERPVDVFQDEVILDSGDSEIIISEEDLEVIRRYMQTHSDEN